MKTAAIYARVSSTLQDIENSIQAQVTACQEYAKAEGMEILELYTDKAESGTSSSRPEFQRMIADARQKKFNIILVHKLDRFARNREDAVTFKALLRKSGVELFSVTEKLGDDIYSRLVEGILEVIAEFYSLNLGEEVKKGKQQVLKRGYWPGGNPAFGYKLEKVIDAGEEHARLVINPETAPIVLKIFSMVAEGKYIKDVLDYLNGQKIETFYKREAWNYRTIFALLSRRVYLGEARTGNKTKENSHPAIITPELFALVQTKKKGNQGHRKGSSFFLLSSGIAKCGCGANLSGQKYTKKLNAGETIYRYYQCQRYLRHRTGCTGEKIKADFLEEKVKEIFFQEIGRYSIENKSRDKETAKKRQEKKIKSLEKEIKEIGRKKKNLIAAIAAGIPVEEVKEELSILSAEKEFKDRVLKEERENLLNFKTPETSQEFIELAKVLPEFSEEKLKDVLREFIKLEVNITTKECRLEILTNPGHKPIIYTFST